MGDMAVFGIGQEQTMTSREIADLVELRHDNVKRSVMDLHQKGIISHPQIEDGEKSGNGVIESVFRIAKRDTYVIVARLSPQFTARLVDRWQELEEKLVGLSPAIPKNFAEALRMAADYQDQLAANVVLLASQKPAVEFVERYVESTGLKSFREVCKLLGANEVAFRQFLKNRKIMYILNCQWVPYAEHIDAGRLCIKVGTSEGGHAYNQTKFTTKGVNWVAGQWAIHNIRA